jgi:tRNA(Arg) A34 adenosine deaminase TadA
MPDEDIRFMELALRQAHLAIERGGGEVGCVITRNGEVIAEGYDEGELPAAVLHTPALRQVHAGLRVGEDQSHRVWRHAGLRALQVFLRASSEHDRLHPRRIPEGHSGNGRRHGR